MYVFLVIEDCCNGLLEAGDLVVYSERGYERFRGLPMSLGGAIGIAALDGKIECLHPAGGVTDLRIHELLRLASSLGPYPGASSGPAPHAEELPRRSSHLRLLKD